MIRSFLISLLLFDPFGSSTAQILCVQCFSQNPPISPQANNMVLNGSFENGCTPYVLFCPSSIGYACDLTDWTCTGGGPHTYARIVEPMYSVIPDGVMAPYLGNFLCSVCPGLPGDTSCLIPMGCTVTGLSQGFPVSGSNYGGVSGVSLQQTVNGLIAGSTYVLEFWAGGEFDFFVPGLFAVDVGFGDTLLRNSQTYSNSAQSPDTIGTRYVIQFNAVASSHTVKFTNWGHMDNGSTELIIDDVRLYAILELSAGVPLCTMGFDDHLGSGVKIFPNPVDEFLNVELPVSCDAEIRIHDALSRVILNKPIQHVAQVSIQHYTPGVYYYVVSGPSGVMKSGKFLKTP